VAAARRRNRTTGAVLYALTAALLAAGAVWWVRTAPPVGTDPAVAGWRASVEQLLPDRADQITAGTLVVRPNGTREVDAETQPRRYYLFFLCAGQGQVLIQPEPPGRGSGQVVPCSDRPQLQSLVVDLADRFYLMISGQSATTVVFRWQLTIASR
jgi:hypothetical protein